MSFDALWALGLLPLAALLWWLHRRAQPAGEHRFSAFFLLDAVGGEGARGRRLRAPLLLALRGLALLALVAVVVGPALPPPSGTVVLAAGPFVADSAWPEPVRVVRAGLPPTEHPGGPTTVAPVASRPDWAGAALLARQRWPQARVVRAPSRLPPARIWGAGTTIAGTQVLVTAAVAGLDGWHAEEAPVLRLADGTERRMERRNGDFAVLGDLPPGPASVRLPGTRGATAGAAWPVCVPDAAPLRVARTGWPPAVALALSALDGVVTVDAEVAEWRLGPVPPAAAGLALFAPATTSVGFGLGSGPERAAAALSFAADLPPPGAVVRRWRALDGLGTAILFADGAPVVDHRSGPAGQGLRFGFEPEDTDLTATAGWPILFADRALAARLARVPCRPHAAGTPAVLALAPGARLRVTAPDGATADRVADELGRAVLDGLDQQGHYVLRLATAGATQTAWLAVEPPLDARLDLDPAPTAGLDRAGLGPAGLDPAGLDPAGPDLAGPDFAGLRAPALDAAVSAELGAAAEATARAQVRRWAGAAAALLLCAALVRSRRWRAPLAWLGVAAGAATAWGPTAGQTPPGPVVVVVDRSASMPEPALAAAVAAVESALAAAGGAGERPGPRVEGAQSVMRVVPQGSAWVPAAALEPGADGTRHGPLLHAAAALAGPTGAVVLLTDGRADDGPVPAGLPVWVVPVAGVGPDARVVAGRAEALGARVFVQVEVAADRPVRGLVRLGRATLEVRFDTAPQRVQAVVPRADLPGAGDQVTVSVAVPDDRLAANDTLRLPVQTDAPEAAVAVGAAAAEWLRAGGLRPEVVPAEALLEDGGRFAQARAVALHEVAAARLDPEVVPRLRRFVEAGGLLLLSGRTAAFGPGGWGGTPLEHLSPLRADPRPAGAGRLGVLLLLDRSGSMAEDAGGIGAAGVASLSAGLAASLAPDDLLGVVAFATDPEVLHAPVVRTRLDPARLPVPALARGGTRLAPALRAAAKLLAGVPAEARVVVVVSDGQFADAPPEAARALAAAPPTSPSSATEGAPAAPSSAGPPADGSGAALAALAAELRGAGVRVVAVLVGAEPTVEPLTALAAATGGQARQVTPEQGVLRLAQAGVLGAATEAGLLAGPASVLPEAAWSARVGGAAPPVAGRVRVSAQARARVLARAEGEPLLAEWSLGAGRVVALATDAWALSGAQWASLLAPAAAPRPAPATLTAHPAGIFYQGAPEDPPPAGPLNLADGQGGRARVALRPTGPGSAWAPWPAGLAAAPAVLAAQVATVRGPLLARLARPPALELGATGVDLAAVQAQAGLGGGGVIEAAQAARARAARRPGSGRPLAPGLALLALLALLAETARWAGAGARAARAPSGRRRRWPLGKAPTVR